MADVEQTEQLLDADAGDGWRQTKDGSRFYLPRPGGGLIFRRSEEETPEEARVRDQLSRGVKAGSKQGRRAAGKQERPRGKGRRPDPTPPGERQAKPKPQRATAEQLAAAVEIPLLAPMLFARYAWNCEHCAAHFRAHAPAAARDVVTVAIDTENIYLLRLLEGWQRLVATFLGAGKFPGLSLYAIVPVLHHLAPEPMLNFAGPMMGVPPRPRPAAHTHRPGPRHAETQGSRPGPPASAQPPPAPAPPSPAGMADIAAAAAAAGYTPEQAQELARQAVEQQAANGQGPAGLDPAERARAREIALMQERETLRAQLAEQAAYEQMARRGQTPQANRPPYSARENGAPSPTPPTAPDGASSAGSPLPPEAEA